MSLYELSSYLESPITWIMFLYGLFIGSFLNVCIYRIPLKIFWKKTRSHCPECDALIPIWLNIPVVSWLLLRGRSHCCSTKISPIYPAVELLTGLNFVVCYWVFPFVIQNDYGISFDSAMTLRFFEALVFSCLIIVCSVIDAKLQIIPDVISIPMIIVSPLVAWLHPDLSLKSSLIGVLLGGGVFYFVAWAYFMLRGEAGLGFGDVKLLAAIGGWLGYESILPTVFLGSILGALTGICVIIVTRSFDTKLKLPFGPFLGIGALSHLYFGQALMELLYS